MKRNKGVIHLFIGFGTLLLILLFIYVVVSIAFPDLGDRAVHEIGELTGAAGNLIR